MKLRPDDQQSENMSNMGYHINKLKSTSSMAVSKLDTNRATLVVQELKNKVSYEWKNIYRSLVQSDVL